jgi:hypothetical protein
VNSQFKCSMTVTLEIRNSASSCLTPRNWLKLFKLEFVHDQRGILISSRTRLIYFWTIWFVSEMVHNELEKSDFDSHISEFLSKSITRENLGQFNSTFFHIFLSFQIHFFLIVNRQGKIRLSKWFSTYTAKEKPRIIKEITNSILKRSPEQCNFFDWRDLMIVYRR